MTKFKTVLALALIAFVAAGCGKDKKKSNNQNLACGVLGGYCNYNPYLGNGGLTYDTSGMSYVNQWYQTQDPYIGNSGLIDTKSSSGNAFIDFDSWNPDKCYALQNSQYVIAQYDKSSKKCHSPVVYNKAANADLNAAMNGAGSGLTLIDVKMMGSGVYMLAYAPAYGGTNYGLQPTRLFVIDTKLHSLLNPIRTIEVQSGAQKYLFDYKQQAVTFQ